MSESYTVSVNEISKRLNKDINIITTEEIARLYYPNSNNVIIKCHDINGTPMNVTHEWTLLDFNMAYDDVNIYISEMSESYTVSVGEISKRLNKDIEKITTEEIARLYYPYSDNVIIKCHDINGTPMNVTHEWTLLDFNMAYHDVNIYITINE